MATKRRTLSEESRREVIELGNDAVARAFPKGTEIPIQGAADGCNRAQEAAAAARKKWQDAQTRISASCVAVAALVALALVAAGCGDDDDEEPTEKPQKLVTGSFVANVAGSDLFVAVVAAPAEQGSNERPVRVYLCAGRPVRPVNEWFEQGSATGNAFRLTSAGGATVRGDLTAEGATGKVTLANGRSHDFKAGRATGVAGFYRVRVFTDGRMRGASETGGRVSGRVSRRQRSDGFYSLTGTITGPNGATATLDEAGAPRSPAKAIETRWVVLRDGRAQGGKVKSTGGTETDFSVRFPP